MQVPVPVKIFGDIHGQYGDLMQYFAQLGTPCDWMPNGDISTFNYLFLGDWVDRGKFSLETVCVLFALKCQYPARIFLIRGNHEDAGINQHMGFFDECVARLGPHDGVQAFKECNSVFTWLSPAAIVERCIFCVHGGIGRVKWLRQIETITKPCSGVQELIAAGDARGEGWSFFCAQKHVPLRADLARLTRIDHASGPLLTDILWSDPLDRRAEPPAERPPTPQRPARCPRIRPYGPPRFSARCAASPCTSAFGVTCSTAFVGDVLPFGPGPL